MIYHRDAPQAEPETPWLQICSGSQLKQVCASCLLLLVGSVRPSLFWCNLWEDLFEKVLGEPQALVVCCLEAI